MSKSKKDYKILFGKDSNTKPAIGDVPALKAEVVKQIDDAFTELSNTYPKVNEKYVELKKGLEDKIEMVVGDSENLPFENDKFDANVRKISKSNSQNFWERFQSELNCSPYSRYFNFKGTNEIHVGYEINYNFKGKTGLIIGNTYSLNYKNPFSDYSSKQNSFYAGVKFCSGNKKYL